MERGGGGGPLASGHLLEKHLLNSYWTLNLSPWETPKIESPFLHCTHNYLGERTRVLLNGEWNSVWDNMQLGEGRYPG